MRQKQISNEFDQLIVEERNREITQIEQDIKHLEETHILLNKHVAEQDAKVNNIEEAVDRIMENSDQSAIDLGQAETKENNRRTWIIGFGTIGILAFSGIATMLFNKRKN